MRRKMDRGHVAFSGGERLEPCKERERRKRENFRKGGNPDIFGGCLGRWLPEGERRQGKGVRCSSKWGEMNHAEAVFHALGRLVSGGGNIGGELP